MSQTLAYDVVAIGELLIDFVTQGKDAAGYPLMKANPGGAPGNFLAALSACGGRTALLGKVGDDAFGRLLVRTLGQAGIDTQGVLLDGSVFTTLAFVTLDAGGDRIFSFARKPGADTMLRAEELDLSMIDRSRSFHFGTLSMTDEPARTATRRAVAYAKEHGKCITFDPNLRMPLWQTPEAAKDAILWGLEHADIVKISEEEVRFLWPELSLEAAADRLLQEFDVALVLLTMGAEGCLLKNRAGEARMPALPAKTVDTTGAGDVFGGSAVSRILALERAPGDLAAAELCEIARFASTAAGISTERYGAIPSVPTPAEIEARMPEVGGCGSACSQTRPPHETCKK